MLGIIIGVASVITMIAIGQGSKKSIQAQISEMGSNMIMIHPGGDRRGGVRRDPSEMQTLKLENYQALRNEASFLSVISMSGVRFFRFSFSTILVISTVNTLAIMLPFSYPQPAGIHPFPAGQGLLFLSKYFFHFIIPAAKLSREEGKFRQSQ